jgi:hypothetical protein
MGGFSAQLQSPQSSNPAGKGAGMSSMQMGQNPIQQSMPQNFESNMAQAPINNGTMDPNDGQLGQMLQGNQMPQMNQATPNGLGMLGGSPAQDLKNPYQTQLNGMLNSTGMMGGQVTMPGQGGQPQLGMPNAYSNTMQPWDNSVNQQGRPSGKGMGASGLSGKGA